MSLDAILSWLEDGDDPYVRSALINLSESDRKVLGPKARGWLTRGNPTRVTPKRAAMAVLATAGGWRQAMLVPVHSYGFIDAIIDDAVAILQARAPAWLPELVDALVEDEDNSCWRLARGLVRAEAVPVPDNPDYFRGTVRGLPDFYAYNRHPLIERLDADPGLVGDHLLRMLSTEGTGRLLAFHDKFHESTHAPLPDFAPFPAATWRITFLTLAQDGRLDRGQLLDTVLAAPLRDWAVADLGWYVGLHDALEPTLDEVIARQATYARLLTVEHGPSVKTAQREILRMLRDPRFVPDPVLDASRATLGRSDKAAVVAQLRLLGTLREAYPDVEIADAVRVAADHPRPDVRAQAAKLLVRLGQAPPAIDEIAPFAVSAPEPWPARPSVEPVSSPDELAEVLLGLIEETDAIEMERAIDGLLRLADDRPTTAELLLSRAATSQYYVEDPRIAPAVLARAWLTPRKRGRESEWPIVLGQTVLPTVVAPPETFVGAIGRRLTEIAHAVRRGRHTSVALPLSADGSLDVDDLNHRLSGAARSRPVLELELAVALLRVPEADRSSVAIPRAARRSAVLARVLDDQPLVWEREVVPYKRYRWDPEGRMPLFRNRSGREGGATDGILARSTPERTCAAELSYGEYDSRFEQTLALGASMLPHEPDVLAAHAHPYLYRDLRKDRACAVPVLDALARSRAPIGAPASSALVLGLGARDARARTAAQDALVDRARHGALDGTEVGRQAVLLLRDDLVVGKRISTGLAEVARASDSAVHPVLDALQALMDVLPGRRDAAPFVELAGDLAERTGRRLRLPPELLELAAGRSTSMLAKAARRLA